MNNATAKPDPPIRVLLWSPGGAGLHYGGPGMTAYRLYAADTTNRFRLTLAHGYADQSDYERFDAHHLVHPLGNTAWSQWRFVTSAERWLDQHAGQFDVFHGLQGFDLTVAPAVAARRRCLPTVVKLAAHQSDLADKSGWRALLRRPARRRRLIHELDAVIAISNAIADELLSYGLPESRIARIPNAVDTEQFQPADENERVATRRQLGLDDRFTVLFVGTLSRRKRPHLLAEAAAELLGTGVDLLAVFVGPHHEPDYLKQIETLFANTNAADRFKLVPFTENIAPWYRAADVFVLPSKSEGMPNAMLEAMSSGLPCIGTPISGITDLLADGGRGTVVEPEAGALADAIRRYADDAATRAAHGSAARQHVLTQYSTAVALDRHEQLFRSILRGG